LRRSRAVLFELLIRSPRLYRRSKRVLDRAVPWVARPMQREAFVLLALATPKGSND
jgi:hypothetical protein